MNDSGSGSYYLGKYSITNRTTLLQTNIVNPTDLEIIDDIIYVTSSPAGQPAVVKAMNKTNFSTFILEHNYPNPFNPTTTIRYNIPELSFVTLKVYDVLGNEISALVNEELPAGSYEVEFDGSGLTSGIYYYQVKAGNYADVKKMIFLK